jgi:hypothetical protein
MAWLCFTRSHATPPPLRRHPGRRRSRRSHRDRAGDVRVDADAWRSAGITASIPPAAAQVTFIAAFPRLEHDDPEIRFIASAPVELSDLLVALVFIGPDDQLYWAARLYG